MKGVPLVFLSSAILILAVTSAKAGNVFVTSPRECLQECSDEVKCVVQKRHCRLNETSSKAVASHATNFKLIKREDDTHTYVDMEWNPPADGSFRDLEAFDIHVHSKLLSSPTPGDLGFRCFTLRITDPEWIQIYSNTSVKFYLKCIQVPRNNDYMISVAVYSLPINRNFPKIVSQKIHIRKEFWNPGIQRWADLDNNVHVLISTPHPEAWFYNITLIQYEDGKRPVLAFRGSFLAHHVELKDQSNSTTVADKQQRPHFLIKSIRPKDANYTIGIRPLYKNGTGIAGALTSTRPFTLNFTTKRVLPTTSPNASRVVPITEPPGGQSTPTLAIVLIVTTGLFFGIVLILWKANSRRTASHQWMLCKFLVPSLSNNAKELPKIVPVYCEENEYFVRAVECHVTLLRRYVNVLPTPQFLGSSPRPNLCPLLRRNPLLMEPQTKVTDVIVYLSPSLDRLLRQDHVHGLSRLDKLCHRTLRSLRYQRQQRQSTGREEFTIHVVTFDCFQSNELEVLPVLSHAFSANDNAVTANTNINIRTNTMTAGDIAPHSAPSWDPIKLASFVPVQNSWRLENLDQLLFNLCHAREFPQDLPAGLMLGWHESPEARMVEQYLNRFGSPSTSPSASPSAPPLSSIASATSQKSACFVDDQRLELDEESCPSYRSHFDSRTGVGGDVTSSRGRQHPSLESGCISANSEDFYSCAKQTFYTQCPDSPPPKTLSDKIAFKGSDINTNSRIHYTSFKPDKIDVLPSSMAKSILPSSRDHHYQQLQQHHSHNNRNQHQHPRHNNYDNHHRIKPPLPVTPLLGMDSCDAKSLAESDTDNECLGSSLESDSLLYRERNNSLGRRKGMAEKDIDRYSVGDTSLAASSAISPPSSVMNTLSKSISDLIAANNATRGWSGGPFA